MQNFNPQLFRVDKSIEIKLSRQGNSALFPPADNGFEEFQRNTLHTCCWRYCKKNDFWRFLKSATRVGIDGDKLGCLCPPGTQNTRPLPQNAFFQKKLRMFKSYSRDTPVCEISIPSSLGWGRASKSNSLAKEILHFSTS